MVKLPGDLVDDDIVSVQVDEDGDLILTLNRDMEKGDKIFIHLSSKTIYTEEKDA